MPHFNKPFVNHLDLVDPYYAEYNMLHVKNENEIDHRLPPGNRVTTYNLKVMPQSTNGSIVEPPGTR